MTNDPLLNPTRRKLLAAAGATALVAGLPTSGLAAFKRRRSLRVAHLTDIHVQPEQGAPEGMAKALRASRP